MLVSQLFGFEIFSILEDTNVDFVLTLLAVVGGAKVKWDVKPDLDWFPYMFDEEIDAFMTEEEVFAAEPTVAADAALNDDTLLAVNEDDGWELEGGVGLD